MRWCRGHGTAHQMVGVEGVSEESMRLGVKAIWAEVASNSVASYLRLLYHSICRKLHAVALAPRMTFSVRYSPALPCF